MTNQFYDPEQKYEKEYWGSCVNTFFEDQKHYVYARWMGLSTQNGYVIQKIPGPVLDIGGGPSSMLLKLADIPKGSVTLDPIAYPEWVYHRYASVGIHPITGRGEDLPQEFPQGKGDFAEVWIYNVLQHVEDPEAIINTAKEYAPFIRIFEWINIPPYPGHPQELKSDKLDSWIGGETGHVGKLTGENGCFGEFYSNFTRFGGKFEG